MSEITKYTNEHFYKDGKFDVEAAKAAYFEMFKAFNYPIYPVLTTENFWVTDFALGDFVNVGMAGIFWVNEIADGYFAHEIYLLPGQMIAEHAHEATALTRAKMESWHVRHGEIFAFGEEGVPAPSTYKIPESQKDFVTVSLGHRVNEGEVMRLNRITARHFMIAGPQGAIVSEYGTPHDGEGLRFSNPNVAF